jgi:hypothetical protein
MTTLPNSEYVTRTEFEVAMTRIDGRFDVLEARVEALVERVLATGIRWTAGVSFGLYALTFGLILFVVSRELAH